MLPYLFLVLFSIILFGTHIYINNVTTNKITTFLWVVVMTIFVGSQDDMGTDYSTYIEQIETPWFFPVEPFTLLVFFVLRQLDMPTVSFFYIYAFLTYFFISKAILLLDKKNRFLASMLLFQCGFFFQSFNIIRQILACAVFIYGAYLVCLNRGGWRYLLFACSVHYSAVVGLVLCFFSRRVKNINYLCFCYFLSLIICVFGGILPILVKCIELILPYTPYAYYLDSSLLYDKNNTTIGVVYIFMGLVLFFISIKHRLMMENYERLLPLFFLGTIGYNLFLANETLQRTMYYAYFLLLLVIPLWTNSISVYWRFRIVLLLCAVYFFFFFVSLDSDSPFIPYKTILL